MVTKDSRIAGAAAAAPIAGRWSSLWMYEGQPSHGAAPSGAASAPDNTTQGSFRQTSPGGGRQKWLDSVVSWLSSNATVVLYDRLLHKGGLDGTSVAAQTVGGTLTRNTGGAGNQIWIEIYTQIGATATTATISYTNQAGTAGRTTPSFAIGGTGLREQARSFPVPLQDGDTGVQSVQSITLAASTTTVGDFGVTIVRPIAVVGCSTGGLAVSRTFIDGTMPDVSTSCLAAMLLSSVTTVQTAIGFFLSMAER